MYKCKYIEPIQPHIRFGVELKEIYPPWYLHPALKNLMYLAQINIRDQNSRRFDIEEICGKSQIDGSIKQRLKLKELMVHGRNILNVKVAPGTPIWLLRHFLGLLPSPIFSTKSDADHWLNFASTCYYQLTESIKTRKSCHDLKFTIAFELAHLPNINLTFLFEFFDLLRFLASKTLPDSKEVVDNHATLVIVKYFTPSLFVRPYTPGILKKVDKKYIALLLYIIHFWPEMRLQIYDLLSQSIEKNENKFHKFQDQLNKYANNNDYLKDIGTQTEPEPDIIANKDSELSLNFSDISEISINTDAQTKKQVLEDFDKIEGIYNDCNLHLDSPPQKLESEETIIFPIKPKPSMVSTITRNVLKRSRGDKVRKVRSETSSARSVQSKGVKVVASKVRKCLRKTNYEIIILEVPYKVRRVKRRNIKITTLRLYQKDNKDRSTGKKKQRKYKRPDVVVVEEHETKPDDNKYKIETNNSLLNATGEYIYDTFIGKCNDETKCFNFNKNPFAPKIDTSSPTYIDFNSPIRSIDFDPTQSIELFDRITQFGWSYTKSTRCKLNLNESQSSQTKMNPNKISFDYSEMNISNNNSSIPLTQKCSATRKNSKSILDHLKEVGSCFNLFKLTSKVSASCEDIQCNIKYKKILKSSYSI